MRYLRDPVYQGEYTLRERVRIVIRLFVKGVLPGGLPRVWAFLRSVPWLSVARMPQSIVDWIAGLSMRQYVQRHFGVATEAQRTTLTLRGERLRVALRAYVDRGAAVVSLESVATSLPRLRLALAGGLDRAFFARTARHVRALMRRTPSLLTLHIDALSDGEVSHLQRLLKRLAPFGDRISIVLHEQVLDRVRVDSSVFHLVLSGHATASSAA
jgi:hypothetical protein